MSHEHFDFSSIKGTFFVDGRFNSLDYAYEIRCNIKRQIRRALVLEATFSVSFERIR